MNTHNIRCARSSESPPLRGGFTLVELLVVIAIIGVLVGLLLPAVQAAREAARRVSCLNNMMQLGLAVHHHEFSNEHFPAGSINPTGPVRNEPIGDHTSWVVQILPFIEQQPLYEHLDLSVSMYSAQNREARSRSIDTMLCPSFPGPAHVRGEGTKWGTASYAGCHHEVEAPIDTDNNGLLFLNSAIRFGDIRDGASQTILLGEIKPSPTSLGWASGTRATLRNTSGFQQGAWPDEVSVETGSLTVGGFGSLHAGGANFVIADGSVRFFSESVDPELFRQLGHRADGELPVEE